MTGAAAVLGALGVLAVLLMRSRAGVAGGLGALAVAEILLVRDLLPVSVAATLTSAAGLLALVVAVPMLGGLAALLIRFPGVVPPLVVGAAPFRSPFEFGTENRFFVAFGEGGALGRLLPLYLVIAAAALALAWRSLRGEAPRPFPRILAGTAAGLVALTTVSYLWAYDPPAAQDRIAFFVLPFAALLAVVARSPFRPWLPRVLAIEAVALAGLFAAVGLWEWWTRELIFYDPKVAIANSYTSYFRVTSLFSDPSIYGRHVVAAIAILVVALWVGRVALVVGGAAIAFLWAGLYFSYSQSSMIALAAAVVVVSYLVADRRARRILAVVAAALLLVGTVAFATLLREESAARVTSGRSSLVTDTWVVFRNHPVAGVGVASQPAASRDQAGGPRRTERNVSHTAPLTIAAELGILGIALYLAFLAGAARLLWAARRRDEALGLALLGVVIVFFVHSLFYGVFFDDPLLWAALGVGSTAVVAREQVVRSLAPVQPRSRSAPAPAAPL